MEIAVYLILFGLLAFFIISNITLRSEHSTGDVILGAFLNGIPIGFFVFLALFSARQWYQRAAYILAGLAAMVLILGFIGRWWHRRNIALWAAIAVAGAGAVFAADRYDAYLESIRVPEHFDYTVYTPHTEGTLAARLDGPADLVFTDQLPRMDGATALYPVYAAFAQAVYPASIGELEPYQLREIINCSTTRNAYIRIVDGDCDIIFVAGPSKEQEDYAKKRGVELQYIPIGREAFVFFVHPDNPLNSLTLDQIRDIYAGRTTEWAELGVNGLGSILAYQRSEGSGSQTALERFVMRDTPLMPAPTEMRQGGMGDMMEAVSDYHNHRNAIGYSFRFYSTVLMKDFRVKLLAVDGIEPTLDSIESGTYPLASDFYAVIRSDADEATLDLVEWIQGPQGQELIQRTGYTPSSRDNTDAGRRHIASKRLLPAFSTPPTGGRACILRYCIPRFDAVSLSCDQTLQPRTTRFEGVFMMELGKKIKQLRFKAGLTQEQLAEKLGIGAQSVSKWENAVAMPDITALPLLAEIFGVSIDDLFDLTTEQRLNRIENRMDAEEELPADVFREFECFLQAEHDGTKNQKRATGLLAYLYWHRMNAEGQKASRYAKEAITRAPGEKECQWILSKTDNHAVWDWNMANHTQAIAFYRELAEANPDVALPYMYLLDNLIADHRADEAERWLDRYCTLEKAHPVMKQVYRAYIALARFDESTADGIMEALLARQPEDDAALFEAAQYYAAKADYKKAIGIYERAFAADTRRPRFQDALMAITDIYEIMGDYASAAKTCDRIIDLLENEWGLTEETDSSVTAAKKKKARLLAMA